MAELTPERIEDMRRNGASPYGVADLLAEVERLRAAAPASEDDEWRLVRLDRAVPTFMDGQGDEWVHIIEERPAGSPPPTPALTPALTRERLRKEIHYAGLSSLAAETAADAVMALIAQPDREPLARGVTSRVVTGGTPNRSMVTFIIDQPPGTAVRVDEDTGS
jgi:hypothetical protein